MHLFSCTGLELALHICYCFYTGQHFTQWQMLERLFLTIMQAFSQGFSLWTACILPISNEVNGWKIDSCLVRTMSTAKYILQHMQNYVPPQALCFLSSMKIRQDGTADAAMDLWMVTMTTAQMGALEGEDPLAMIEVGVAPTVVTGVEARLINHCKMQVGKSWHALECLIINLVLDRWQCSLRCKLGPPPPLFIQLRYQDSFAEYTS